MTNQRDRVISSVGKEPDYLNSFSQIVDLYRLYRSQEEHENDLINHRTTWLVTIQSVLIATFGFSFQKFYEIAKSSNALVQESITLRYEVFLMVLCVIGLSSCIFAYLSVKAGSDAQIKVRKEWSLLRLKMPDVGLPPLAGGGHDLNDPDRMKGNIFSRAIVFIFSILWILIILAVVLKISINMSVL